MSSPRSLDSSRYPKTAALVANMVAQDLKTVVSEIQQGGRAARGLVAIDEFSALDGNHLLGLFQRARSAGISLILSRQEMADLQRVDRGFREQVIGNVETLIGFRQNVPESAELIASIAGTREVWINTFQTERKLGLVGGISESGTGSKRRGEEFIVHPNEIKAFGVGEALVIQKNPHRVSVVRVAR